MYLQALRLLNSLLMACFLGPLIPIPHACRFIRLGGSGVARNSHGDSHEFANYIRSAPIRVATWIARFSDRTGALTVLQNPRFLFLCLALCVVAVAGENVQREPLLVVAMLQSGEGAGKTSCVRKANVSSQSLIFAVPGSVAVHWTGSMHDGVD